MPFSLSLGVLFLKAIECQNYKPLSEVSNSNTNENDNYNKLDFNRRGSKEPFDNRARRQSTLLRMPKTAFVKNERTSRLQVDNGTCNIKQFLKNVYLKFN